MSVRAFGAVCDVSALVDRTSFERAQRLLDGGDLYLPSATYRLALREALELYRELASDVGNYLCKSLNDGRTSENLIDELRSWRGDSMRAVTTAVRKLSQTRTNPGELNFRYITWDLTPILREYLKQHVLQPEVVRELCERALLLVASPVDR